MKPVAFLSRLRAKGKAWHTPSQTDPTVGLFRNMLLVFVFSECSKKERYDMSTRDCVPL